MIIKTVQLNVNSILISSKHKALIKVELKFLSPFGRQQILGRSVRTDPGSAAARQTFTINLAL